MLHRATKINNFHCVNIGDTKKIFESRVLEKPLVYPVTYIWLFESSWTLYALSSEEVPNNSVFWFEPSELYFEIKISEFPEFVLLSRLPFE